jgi:hypothetical protein
MSSLDAIKKQKWFYEFTLPDGSVTESYLPNRRSADSYNAGKGFAKLARI